MPATGGRKAAFPPVFAPDARLLILGSLPGDASLAAARYYAHPTNAFWWLAGEVLGELLADLAYADRLARLVARGVALWDVVADAERPGSLDAAIRDARPHDLGAFAARLPLLGAIAFNGGTAARVGRRALGPAGGRALIDLPSSSAAHAGLSRAAKRERWLRLREHLPPPRDG